MSDWTAGYAAAISDFTTLVQSRGLMTEKLQLLLQDLQQDALVIEHEQGNRLQRRRLVAGREALPLFVDPAA
jgi:hypothetical protein